MKRPVSNVGQRFFVDSPIDDLRDVAVTGEESRHLATVLRGRPGDEVVLFDGSGSEFTAVISKIAKSAVHFTIVQRREINRELPFELSLGVALPKGERQRWLIEKAVELGVTRLIPLETVRGVAQPTAEACQRLRRFVIEAAKQCGRNRLMEITSPRSVANYLNDWDPNSERWFAHPDEAAADVAEAEKLDSVDGKIAPTHHPLCPVAIAVGPEGGFAPDEVAAARQTGWRIIRLGPRILRIETAALALCARLALR